MRAAGGGAPAPRGRQAVLAGCALVLLVLAVVAVLGVRRLWPERPRLTQEEVRSLVAVTLQREARAAFLVTGVLELTATTRVRNTKTLLPGLLNVPLGSAESTVRVPGRAWYGVAVGDVRAESIRLSGDTVYLTVPEPRVQAVEARLEDMEVRSEAGWLRVGEDAVARTQQRALELVRPALRAQAERHLADSEQARIHTAETLHELLRPVFVSAGVREPVFRFRLSERLHYTGERSR